MFAGLGFCVVLLKSKVHFIFFCVFIFIHMLRNQKTPFKFIQLILNFFCFVFIELKRKLFLELIRNSEEMRRVLRFEV